MFKFLTKRWIYFHVDELSRDAVVASALYRVFDDYGGYVCIGNRRITALLKGKLKALQNVFDVLVMPRVLFFDGFENFRGSRVVLFTESLGRAVTFYNVPTTGYVLLDKRYMEGDATQVEKVDLFLSWSALAMDFIAKYHPSLIDRFRLVGHPRFDRLCVGTKRQARQEKRVVGIVTRQTILNPFTNQSLLSLVFDSFSETDNFLFTDPRTGEQYIDQDYLLADRIYNEVAEILLYFKIVKILLKEKFDVVIRVHPRESHAVWRNFIKKSSLSVGLSDRDSPFSDFLRSVTHIVTPASTSIYDAINMGVKPILMNRLDAKFELHHHFSSEDRNPLMRHITAPESVEQLLEVIKNGKSTLIDENEVKRIISYETGGDLSEFSCTNIALEISKLRRGPAGFVRIAIRLTYALLIETGVVGIYTYVRSLFRFETEEGATFSLHPLRIRQIRNLTHYGRN